MNRLLLAVALSVTAFSAAAATVSGRARVMDGDTIDIAGVHVRFEGVDAPETDQICLDGSGKRWTCGVTARDRLRDKIGEREVSCTSLGTDQYGRTLGVCRLGNENLNRWTVEQGLALAYRYYSNAYVSDEDHARELKSGLWRGTFVAPWDWRHRSPATVVMGAVSVPLSAHPELTSKEIANDAPNTACTIKGNVNRNGDRIFHEPGQRDYQKVNMGKGNGERWFCSEQEALAAGWRKAMR